MNYSALGLLVVLVGCASPASRHGAAPPAPGVFFVATNGNDHWSGRLATPNRSGTDGPLATPAAALKAVRERKLQATNGASKAATVFLREGTFFLTEPLVLRPEDSDLTL